MVRVPTRVAVVGLLLLATLISFAFVSRSGSTIVNYDTDASRYAIPDIKLENESTIEVKIEDGQPFPPEFGFIAVPTNGFCRPDTDFVVVVHSAPKNFGKRDAMRETFLSLQNGNPSFRILFAIGTTNDTKVRDEIRREHELFGDLLLYNFRDSYFLLTMKMMGWYRYLRDIQCNKLVVKIDDDVEFWPPDVMTYYHNDSRIMDGKSIACFILSTQGVLRQPGNPWYLNETLEPRDVYEPYCSGNAVVFHGSLAKRFYEAARKRIYIHIDDVFMTGYVRRDIKVELIDMIGRPRVFHTQKPSPEDMRKQWLLLEHMRRPANAGAPGV